MPPSDHDLLRQYTENGSESAFAELVRRHLNLVYSAARRQVPSGGLAEDVAQSVFIDLAKSARGFNPRIPVVAWLHLVTRRTAVDLIRRESRMKAREHNAPELSQTVNAQPSPAEWTQLEPLLDEALETLNETDRSVLLLRYFENKNLRDVGQSLGLSEDAAQKRVTRALDRLRTYFGKRGVVVGASGLLTNLSTYAARSAPSTLANTISTALTSAATCALQPAAAVQAAKALAMTTIQKTVFTAAAVVLLTGGAYESYQLYQQHRAVQNLQQRADELTAEALRVRQKHETATRALASVEKRIDTALAQASNLQTGDAAVAAQMRA